MVVDLVINPFQPPISDEEPPQINAADGTRHRHGCVTAWLILMLVGNSFSILMYLTMSDEVRRTTPALPEWAMPALIVIGAVNLACTVMLFRWMKAGFWGVVVTSAVAAGINATGGLSVVQIGGGVIGVVILYAILQISAEGKSTWDQLQ